MEMNVIRRELSCTFIWRESPPLIASLVLDVNERKSESTVRIVEVQSLKICQRQTHFVEVYFHIQMWLVPNNLGTEDENLTADNV